MPKVVSTENDQVIEVWVSAPGDVNRLYICTGIAIVNLKGESEDRWTQESVMFWVGPTGRDINCIAAIAAASLAKVYNDKSWNSGGFYVGPVEADWDDGKGRVKVTADIAARDEDGLLWAISYQVFILVYQPKG